MFVLLRPWWIGYYGASKVQTALAILLNSHTEYIKVYHCEPLAPFINVFIPILVKLVILIIVLSDSLLIVFGRFFFAGSVESLIVEKLIWLI